ncbi:MAG: hypothetical protein ACPHID_01110 [Thermoplasmatota archaeon]
MNLDGILPSSGIEASEQEKPKLPSKIPNDAIWPITSEADVDELPRGALAFLQTWDDDLALDLVVAGAGLTLLTRADHDQLGDHEDFDPEGFGVLDGDTLELPGGVVYARDGDDWLLQSPASSSENA